MRRDIELSENAFEFARSRCGSLTVEQYVNRLLERLYVEMLQPAITSDGFSLLSVVDAITRSGERDFPHSEDILEKNRIDRFCEDLKKEYPEKVPRSVFYGKGAKAGLPEYLLKLAERKCGSYVVPMDDPGVKMYVNPKARTIMNALSPNSKGVSLPVFLNKCEQSGLLKEETSVAIRHYKSSLKAEAVDDEYSTFMIADMVRDYLLNVYGSHIPRHVFFRKCVERGVARERLELLEQKYPDVFAGIVGPADYGGTEAPPKAPEPDDRVRGVSGDPPSRYCGPMPAQAPVRRSQQENLTIDHISKTYRRLKNARSPAETAGHGGLTFQLARIIYDQITEMYGGSLSEQQLYLKYKESGLSDQELRRIERAIATERDAVRNRD